jgi:3-mercaptopyruvate sulfurtransferase SseA
MMNFFSHQKQRKRFLAQFVAASVLLFLVAFTLNGCSTESYDIPPGMGGTQISSLLSPQQLNAWIGNGYQDERGNRVVIFDGSSPANYNTGHIPGSYNVSYNTDFCKTRSDGPMNVALMVADGPMMDGLVQKYGIDGKTSVVVFTGDAMIWSARGYWTFRYWGFPQNRLFVLNGKSTTTNSVWTAAGYTLTTDVPALPTPSTFSVSSWAGNIDQVRAPLDEMQTVSKATDTTKSVIIDVRGESEWLGTTALFSLGMGYQWRNSVWRPYELEFAGTNVGDPYSTISLASAGSQVLKSKDQLLAEWAAAGFTKDKKLYSS